MLHAELSVEALLAHTANMATLSELTGIDRRQLHRRAKTGLTLDEADRCANAVGCHASELWPCWTELATEAASLACECGALFVPTNRRQRFCTTQCRKKLTVRRLRRENQDYRLRGVEYMKAYRLQCHDAVILASRRYYQANRESIIAKQVERERRARAAA